MKTYIEKVWHKLSAKEVAKLERLKKKYGALSSYTFLWSVRGLGKAQVFFKWEDGTCSRLANLYPRAKVVDIVQWIDLVHEVNTHNQKLRYDNKIKTFCSNVYAFEDYLIAKYGDDFNDTLFEYLTEGYKK